PDHSEPGRPELVRTAILKNEVGAVQGVVHFEPDLEALPVPNGERPVHGNIEVYQAWSLHRAAPGVAVARPQRSDESRRVEPVIGRAHGGIEPRVSRSVGPLRVLGAGVEGVSRHVYREPWAALEIRDA